MAEGKRDGIWQGKLWIWPSNSPSDALTPKPDHSAEPEEAAALPPDERRKSERNRTHRN